MNESSLIICVRLKEMPLGTPGALPAPCRSCGEQVWRSVPTLRMTGRLEYLCVQCAYSDRNMDPSTFILTDESYTHIVQQSGFIPRKELMAKMASEFHRRRSEAGQGA